MITPPVDNPEALHRILARTEALFLDFDGPICSVFAGMPASVVVDQLCVVLADGGYGDPPPEIEKSDDPFDVLNYAASLGETEARYVNIAFNACEAEAIITAEPTPGAHNLVRTWATTRKPLVIVSNNSTKAIQAYLDLHHLGPYVAGISGRVSPDPSLLKPSPYLLEKAAQSIGVAARNTLFVGDSISDIDAARRFGCMSIGYANKPGKTRSLTHAGAGAIVDHLVDFSEAISS